MKSRISSAAPSIGVVGLGIMGSAIAKHLIQAGHRVIGYDVRVARLRDLRAARGVVAQDSAHVAAQSQVVITSLPSAEALVQTVDALARAAHSRQIVIET